MWVAKNKSRPAVFRPVFQSRKRFFSSHSFFFPSKSGDPVAVNFFPEKSTLTATYTTPQPCFPKSPSPCTSDVQWPEPAIASFRVTVLVPKGRGHSTGAGHPSLGPFTYTPDLAPSDFCLFFFFFYIEEAADKKEVYQDLKSHYLGASHAVPASEYQSMLFRCGLGG